MVGVCERVYEIAPVFRAEKHDAARYVNEYTSIDMEMGFLESYHDLMCLETKLLAAVFLYLQERYGHELAAPVPENPSIPSIE